MPWSVEGQQAWLRQVSEEIVDPHRPIVDPHHHLWNVSSLPTFLLEDLWADTESGHNIVKTVFVECNFAYRSSGPEHLRPVGETESVADIAIAGRGQDRAEICGIIAHTDLTQDEGVIRAAVGAHEGAGQGLFRGIRHGGAHDVDGTIGWMNATPFSDLYEQISFKRGVALLGKLGLTYDTWHYHFQNRAYAELARSVPDTIMVLDHFGSPVRVGPYADKRDEVLAQWKKDLREIAACDNVVVKLGGLAMPPNGFGWHLNDRPPTSDEFVAAQRDYYLHAIDCFGPDRCMFESNFPVDKMSVSYPVYWNAMKKLTAGFSENDKDQLFRGTATRVYRL